MRIAFWHFHTFRMHRGIETLVVSLANALARRGIMVDIVCARGTVPPLVQPAPEVRVYDYWCGRYYSHSAIVPFYTYHFARHRYDHVVTFFADFGEGPTLRLIDLFRKLHLSLYLCYPASTSGHRYDSMAKYHWGSRANTILADADWVAAEAEEFFKRDVPVVPVGTDTVRFSASESKRRDMRAKLGYDDSDVVLLNVSALIRCKGTWRGIEAVRRLSSQIPSLRYLILGSGEDEASLRESVASYGLDRIVRFGGVTNRLEDFYNAADIFLMLPDAEANSVASIEAMSCGLPVIVSDNGGFAESIPPGAGRHVSVADEQSIDIAIRELANDQTLRHELGRVGRQAACDRFGWDHIATRFLSVVAGDTLDMQMDLKPTIAGEASL